MKHITSIFLLSLLSFTSQAQYTIKGKVTSFCKGHESDSLLVRLIIEGEQEISTDLDGNFEFVAEYEGMHEISVPAGSDGPYEAFYAKLYVTESIDNALIILEYSIDCDFDNELTPIKMPKHKKYRVLKNHQ